MEVDIGDNVKVKYNKGATRWLGFWLDLARNFKDHYTKCMAKARQIEKNIQRVHGQYGLTPANVRKITIAVDQSSALFGSGIRWRGQKNRAEDIQKIINRLARAITGCMKTTPIAPLIAEARLTPAMALLKNRQRRYAERLVGLPKEYQACDVIPEGILETITAGDDEEYHPKPPRQGNPDLGKRLAKHLKPSINPRFGVEKIKQEGKKAKEAVKINTRESPLETA